MEQRLSVVDKAIDWSHDDTALDRAASKVAEYARLGGKRGGIASAG